MQDLPEPVKRLRDEYGVTDGWRLGLLRRFWQHYEDRRLILNGRVIALHSECPMAGSCWAAKEKPAYEGEEAGISLPWIGPDYGTERVLVIGINLREGPTGPVAHFDISRRVIAHFEQGSPVNFDIDFHLGESRYVAAVLASRRGDEPSVDVDRWVLADARRSCALIETIKCGTHSSPWNRMWANCPGYLEFNKEIEFLEPRAIILLGQRQRDIMGNFQFPGNWSHGDLTIDRTQVDDRVVDLYAVRHPSRGYERRSLMPLVDRLRSA